METSYDIRVLVFFATMTSVFSVTLGRSSIKQLGALLSELGLDSFDEMPSANGLP